MGRVAVLALLLYILWLSVKSFLQRLRALSAPPDPGVLRPPVQSETLVPCVACGAYVPASRALRPAGAGGPFCSEACRERGAA